MKNKFYSTLLSLATIFSYTSCAKGEYEQKGVFVIKNISNHDLDIKVFNTLIPKSNPLLISIPNYSSVERVSYAGAGNISYPELLTQGDSIIILFDTGKKITHYCKQPQQVNKQCTPEKNLLLLSQYSVESIDEKSTQFTYTITPSDFSSAL